MAYRQIHISLLSEPWFETLSLPASYLFLFLLIHPLTTPSGFIQISQRRICRDSPLKLDQLTDAIHDLCCTNRVSYYLEYEMFWIKHFWHWQGEGPKWTAHVQNSLSNLPSFARKLFTDTYGMPINRYAIGIDTHAIPPDRHTELHQQPSNTTTTTTTTTTAAAAAVPPLFPPTAAASFDSLFSKNGLKEELQTKFPQIDLDSELTKCSLWWASSKRKLKAPELAFRNWLDKAQAITESAQRKVAPKERGKPYAKVDIGPWDTGENRE